MLKKIFLTLVFYSGFVGTPLQQLFIPYTIGQTSLRAQDAIGIALRSNLGLELSDYEIKQANNNATRANAGFLPSVNLNAGLTPSANYLNQDFSSGQTINRFVLSNNVLGSVSVSYTLFDANKRTYTYNKLKSIRELSVQGKQIKIEQLVSDVLKAYYNVVRQEQLTKIYADQMDFYEERLRLANNLDVLQAEVDLNTQKSQLVKQKSTIASAKISLAQVLSVPEMEINLQDSIELSKEKIDYESIKKTAIERSLILALFQQQDEVLNLGIKELETNKKPRIYLNGAYSINRTDNQAGQLLLNQGTGVSGGLALSYPIFDGNNTQRQIDNAKLDVAANQLKKKVIENELIGALKQVVQNHQNALDVLAIEEQSSKIAQESIVLAMERYRLGKSTVLELKLIQKSYEDTLIRSINARADAKNAEIDLLRLSGQIVGPR
jgi:outer membrane protein